MPERYPHPPRRPEYRVPPEKVSARGGFPLYQLVAAAFVVAALAMSFWLAALLLTRGFASSWWWFAQLVGFWAVLAYLAMPRLHQVFTLLYLPDYFIGRTRTADGLLGDPINLALDGPEADLHAAMEAAGWTKADELSLRSTWGMVTSAVLRRSYPNAPVSDLMLFSRKQDFAYQQEVDGNPHRRHHVRFWRTPDGWKLPGGHQVGWLASATYDRAVGFSIFTMQVTHKIDEDIDVERDYLVDTVRWADPDAGVEVIADFSTAYHHRNGGGDRVRTDGDLPVLDVTGSSGRLGASRGGARVADRSRRSAAVPPTDLLVSGALLALAILVGLLVGLMYLVGWSFPGASDDVADPALVHLALAVGGALLWWGVVARSRVAWVVLMAALTASTASQLWEMSRGYAGFGGLPSVSLAVLSVLTLSSTSVREWVSRDRRDPQVKVPDVVARRG